MGGDTVFPFVRIVGQEPMKRALLLNVVDPKIGGVLVRGEKGTAKSTAVRALAQILPETLAVKGCPFQCDPRDRRSMCAECRERDPKEIVPVPRRVRVVELPLNATEDRISGSLDIEHVLKSGERRFENGILAQANGNLLYVDEVNLLDDHIVDLLLDSAAMGVNHVEREGVSFSHPSRFILVGTMNPEEGSLRPQLLDRFGLSVDISGDLDPRVRAEVIRRRLAFDADPEGYIADAAVETDGLRERVAAARGLLPSIVPDDKIVHMAAVAAIGFKIEGHRADLAMIRAARANAALEGRTEITKDDLLATAGLVLAHRLAKGPFEESTYREEDLHVCLAGL
ncbi:MAG: AAA domain-containing protein [Thermoplasmatales archaeon]|nr:AAA domain-containing protein [Thermoplasmatales archaeon]